MYSSAIQSDASLAVKSMRSATIAPGLQIAVSSEPADNEWDAFLAAVPGGHHVQTSLWSRLKATLGWRVVRIIAKDNRRIVGGAQMLIREYRRGFRIGHIAKGPLFTTSIVPPGFMDAFHEQVRAHNLHCVLVQPPTESPLASKLQACGFRPVRFSTMLAATTAIDLQAGLEEILMRMKRKTRRNVRQTQRSGLQVRRGTADDLGTFYELFTATADRQGFRDYSKSYFQELWKLFGPPGHLQLFLTEKDGRPVSAALRMAFGDTVVCKKRGWNGEFASLRPNEAAEWAAIRWARQAGYRYYDFEGLPRSVAEAVLRGKRLPKENVQSPASYKLGFGGEVRMLPESLAFFPNPLVRWGHRCVYPKVAHWPILSRLVHRLKVN